MAVKNNGILTQKEASRFQAWLAKLQTHSPASGEGFFPLSLTLLKL
jgi:hypothetical protein